MGTTLYLGTDPSAFESEGNFKGHLIHFPVIEIVPKPLEDPELKRAWDDLGEYTHLIFTSKNAVSVFYSHLESQKISVEMFSNKTLIAIGKVTAAHLDMRGLKPNHIAEQEQQEGVITLLKRLDLENAYVFLPRSSLARPALTHFLNEEEIRHQACDLYETRAKIPDWVPDLESIDEIIFTSPSTVSAFLQIFKRLPVGKKLRAVGPITERALFESVI